MIKVYSTPQQEICSFCIVQPRRVKEKRTNSLLNQGMAIVQFPSPMESVSEICAGDKTSRNSVPQEPV